MIVPKPSTRSVCGDGVSALASSGSAPIIQWSSFSLHMGRNSLYRHRESRGQLSHQLAQRPQAFSAEPRSTLGDHHNGIGGDHVRPTCGKGDQIPLITVAVDPIFSPVMFVHEQLELAPEPRMMRMGDAKTSRRYVVWSCSRR